MTQRIPALQLLNQLASGLDEVVLSSSDGELLAEERAGERVDEMRSIIQRAAASASAGTEKRRPLIPRDPLARRDLLRLLSARNTDPGGAISAAFSTEEELADEGVEAELQRLLGTGEDQ